MQENSYIEVQNKLFQLNEDIFSNEMKIINNPILQ